MKYSKQKRKSRNLNDTRIGMAGIMLVVLLLLGTLVYKSHSLEVRRNDYEKRIESLENLIENEKSRTVEIDNLKEYMKTDSFAEEVARDRLGLVKENEIVFEEEAVLK